MGDISTGTIEHFVSGSRQKTFSARMSFQNFNASGDTYELWTDLNPKGVHALDLMSCIQDSFIIKCDWVAGVWSYTPSCVVSMWDYTTVPSNPFIYNKYEPASQTSAYIDGSYNDFQIQSYNLEVDGTDVYIDTFLSNTMVFDIICHGY
jgi:hypothetical protein